jgi:prepilin-type N-terminal cleavage/methylation domain-containing protein
MKRKNLKIKLRPGFTLLEVLLVVAIIAVLAGIVIVALNPGKQLADTRNSQRQSDISTIVNATYQYLIDHSGTLPASIQVATGCNTEDTQEICKTGATCTGLTDLSALTTNQEYIVSMPSDPSTATTNGTGYFITKSGNGRITACAPSTENGKPEIIVTK